MAMANHAKLYDDGVAMAKKPVKPPVERYEGKNVEKTGQSEKPVAILALVFSTMHTIWTV